MALTDFSESSTTGHSVPLAWNHTVNSGSDRILDVLVMVRGGATGLVGGITYNGDALTELKEHHVDTLTRVYHYRRTDPDVGAAQSISIANTDTARIIAYAYSYSGADPATPTYQQDGSNGSGSSSSLNVSTVSGEVAMSALAVFDDGNTCAITVGADQTTEVNTHYQGTTQGVEGAVSSETGGGTRTMSYTWSPTDSHAHIAFAVIPKAAAAGGGHRNLLLTGAG